MKPIQSLLLLLLFTAAVSCKKKATFTVTGNYMIIGYPGGYVYKEPPYYLLTTSELLKDTSELATSALSTISDYHFNVTAPVTKYDSVKDLLNTIPTELFSKKNASIGTGFMPDMGHYYVMASINGVLYQWTFFPDQSSSSPEVQQFVNRLNLNF